MFDSLSSRLHKTLQNLTGRGRLTESNVRDSLEEVRKALLEADVALPVVTSFIEIVRQKAMGQDVLQSVTPGDVMIKIVHDELVVIMGEQNATLNLAATPPAIILLAGLQGSGKTTTAAKLANLLQKQHNKKVLLTSTDIYRPAAIEQLATLAQQVGSLHFPSNPQERPVDIATNAIIAAKKQGAEVVIIDTAGRLHIDDAMMAEIKAIHAATNPIETLFVVDSMTGQDAANTAKAFNDALPLTGIILTKTDGDARGGAALSVRQITGKPIKFFGTGEKIEGLEAFHPERIASRILGMGDILSLVEEAQRNVDQKAAEKVAKKIKKGGFDLEDFRDQLQQMRKMGGMASLLSKLPGASNLPSAVKNNFDDKQLTRMEAIINSMTRKERRFPAIIKGSHKRRIAGGSGTEVPEINRMLKQFAQMQKMMKKLKGNGMQKMMQKMQGLIG
ncbi:MAG: signal recognition particle protein [Pseudomonadota bacterium]|nr:signal recognition particle protein [Pseudomonadota bacterium]